jgi:hypothetical protein
MPTQPESNDLKMADSLQASKFRSSFFHFVLYVYTWVTRPQLLYALIGPTTIEYIGKCWEELHLC